ncbi:MAG: chorismate synthase [Nitrososphaeraceae archaeon]
MVGNTIGQSFTVTSFGESHGKCVGSVVDGCPAGLDLDENDIQHELDLRKPGQSIITTQRKESDTVEILSGTFNGFTTGAPICTLIWNKDSDSSSYEKIKNIPRPGHCDYPALVKYGGYSDYRGSGRFSGRLTASFVMAGAIGKKLLKKIIGVEIIAYTLKIGHIKSNTISFQEAREQRYSNDVRCPDLDSAKKMKDLIMDTRKKGDSLGGVVECICMGIPPGLGEPIFNSLESDLSHALFSIPAVKAVEFGSGFAGSETSGSTNNDLYIKNNDKIITTTNNSGGILGGLSNGMPIVIRVGFKPAASIAKNQKTLDLSSNELVDLKVPGRHDPCVVPRAVPVVESMVSIVLVDHGIRSGKIPSVLRESL